MEIVLQTKIAAFSLTTLSLFIFNKTTMKETINKQKMNPFSQRETKKRFEHERKMKKS